MIVVTGGAGFIGSNIVAGLNDAGIDDILVVDRLGSDDRWQNLARREIADIIPPETMLEVLDAAGDDVEAVIHMGAISSTTERNIDRIVADNIRTSLDLWTWCAEAGVPLIYASSAATYGDGSAGFDDDPNPDALARLRPLNAYGWSKHMFDRRIVRLAAHSGVAPPRWAGLKFFNVYGPNEYHKGDMRSVVAKLFPKVAAGETVELFRSHRPGVADGEQTRDFVWVGDCVDIVLWMLEAPKLAGLFNIGTGRARTWLDLAGAVGRAVGRDPEIRFIDMPEAIRDRYQYHTEARIGRLRKAGYKRPMTSLEDGVAAYVSGFLEPGRSRAPEAAYR